ncbi:CDP-alcohol phosphatidyltransferase family protein [uncultured Gimesia sp.]|uniref:CDP-alcohol phosphatidyltransferase family protein n=1 Tax=uncultured Gimesia sp. TaxID=1678688 RepID=UPI00260978B2|nr:CDP-alcohol phosphatidyltransferase family protein [uncultured Gimesia sp.]
MDEKFLRLWATKNKNDEWWSSFVTSPLAICANYMVVDYKWLTPNLITLFSFMTAIAATAFIIVGGQVNFYLAALLIHGSHILDCMDGQMARYRGISSRPGGFLDKMTDQIQVFLWFGTIGYAAYVQTQNILPVFLAFTGVAFYSLRGYIKYVTIYIEMCDDKEYLNKKIQEVSELEKKTEETAGLGHGVLANLQWFVGEQRKILSFDEGVFIFILSVALIFNILTPVLWIFAISQTFYGIARCLQRGRQLHLNQHPQILTTTEK